MAAVQCLTFLFLFLLQNATSASPLPLFRRPIQSNHSNFVKHPRRSQVVFPVNHSSCDLFAGEWVRDETYPLYRSKECGRGIIDPGFDCQTYGRPDSDYLKFRWKPFNCNVPRFNGVKFLQEMRDKTIMFVGDSLGRNQWESLICMISSSAPSINTHIIHEDPLSTFKILDYNVKVSFYRAPYLVDIDKINGKTTLKLDEISVDASNAWRTADVLLFNTGHWWSHTGSMQGWDLIQSGNSYYQDMDRFVAMEKALRTWAYWVETHVDRSRTQVLFLSISPTHDNPSDWAASSSSGSKNCYGETEPITGTAYPVSSYTDQLRSVIVEVLHGMHNPAFLLDITLLSSLRKDGHPSVYSGLISGSQRSRPDQSADCSHWCLPGLPDTWNQLLYTLLIY